MKIPRTVCAECKWVKHIPDPKKQRRDPDWFDFRCGAIVNDKKIDPVTGHPIYISHEAGFLTLDKHPNCRDMNKDGECPLFLWDEITL